MPHPYVSRSPRFLAPRFLAPRPRALRSCALRGDAPSRSSPERPLRRGAIALGLACWLAGCARGEDADAATTAGAGASRAGSNVQGEPGDRGVPDDAAATVARFLALSTFDAASAPGEFESLLGCDMGQEPFLPAEMLAAYEITGGFMRGDTAVVRARVVTVAEQDRSRTAPGRFTATQRVRRGEWEWDVVSADGRWRVCAGPSFGLVAPDSLTTWRPAGASSASARELGVTVRGPGAP